MMARGAVLTDIQHVLGHERTTTTDIYLRSPGFNALRGRWNSWMIATQIATQKSQQ